MKILVVDDSRVMRKIVMRTLRQAGHLRDQMTEATSAAMAFDMVEADPPDLLLCEWRLPDTSGLELLARLRRAGCDVPFGLLTSDGTQEMRRRAAAAGATFLIAKPFSPDDFRSALDVLTDGVPMPQPRPVPCDELVAGLPHPHRVKDLLEELLARDVLLRPGLPVVPSLTTRVAVGVYVEDRLRLSALVVTDLAFAAYAGAAVGLVSVQGAADLIAGDALTRSVFDNVAEVLNVCAGLFNGPGVPHVRLYAAYSPTDRLPGDVSGSLRDLRRRLDLVVEVEGYGAGALSFLRV